MCPTWFSLKATLRHTSGATPGRTPTLASTAARRSREAVVAAIMNEPSTEDPCSHATPASLPEATRPSMDARANPRARRLAAFVPLCQLGRRKQHILGYTHRLPRLYSGLLLHLISGLSYAPLHHLHGDATQPIFWFELVPIRVETRNGSAAVASQHPPIPGNRISRISRKPDLPDFPDAGSPGNQEFIFEMTPRRLVFDGATSQPPPRCPSSPRPFLFRPTHHTLRRTTQISP